MEYWKHVNEKGETTSVESHSKPHNVPGGIPILLIEYEAYLDSLRIANTHGKGILNKVKKILRL